MKEGYLNLQIIAIENSDMLVTHILHATMDKNQTNIPQFTGPSYTPWALEIQFGLAMERLITAVCDFKGRARTTCPDCINPLAQGALLLLPLADREIARN